MSAGVDQRVAPDRRERAERDAERRADRERAEREERADPQAVADHVAPPDAGMAEREPEVARTRMSADVAQELLGERPVEPVLAAQRVAPARGSPTGRRA